MRGVFITTAVLLCSTYVEQGSSRLRNEKRTETWLFTSAHLVSAIQQQLRRGCVYIIDNKTVTFGKFGCVSAHLLLIKKKVRIKNLCSFFLDYNEQQMALKFWKFLSRREKQAAFSSFQVLDRKPLCRYKAPLYVILSADKNTIRRTQEVRSTIETSFFLQSLVPGMLNSAQNRITPLDTFK
jgi:hypothetical protein